MSLLNLVQQHHAIRLAAYSVRQLPALLIAYIAGRRTNQPRCRVLFHILRHIEAQHRAFITKKLRRQSLRQLCLANARRAEEEEGAYRTVDILKACTRAAHSSAHSAHGLLLPDNTLMQACLQLQQTAAFLFVQLGQRNPRPRGNDRRHILYVYRCAQRHICQRLCQPGLQIAFLIAQCSSLLIILRLHGLLLLQLRIFQLLAQRTRRSGLLIQLHARSCAGLVHQVNSLVRQISVGYITVTKLHSGADSLIRQLQLVEFLIMLAQAQQHRYACLRSRRSNQHRLEATLQRGILFDMLAVFIHCRRTDNLQLATRQRRLDDISGINAALGTACADNRMQLVDEEDDALILAQQLQNRLHARLKLTAVLRSCNEHAQLQREDDFALQKLRHVALHNALRQRLRHSGLAYASLTDNHRIILRAAAENLDNALHLLLTANHRVNMATARL